MMTAMIYGSGQLPKERLLFTVTIKRSRSLCVGFIAQQRYSFDARTLNEFSPALAHFL